MPIRAGLKSLSALLLAAAIACNDAPMGSGPRFPMTPPEPLGVIRGTVSGMTMTAEYVPVGTQTTAGTGVNAAIYGGPGTVQVSGTVDSIHAVAGVSNTWFIRVHMQNLMSFPIGANQYAANARDTMGVFLVFTSLPLVTKPTGCLGLCTVSVANNSGTGNFGTPGQLYFYYHDRPTAKQASPSTDTTRDVLWKFTTNNVAPAADSVTAFTFVLTVSAAWPYQANVNDTLWTVPYDGTADSLPDTQASPPWKLFTSSAPGISLGSEAFGGALAQLRLTDGNQNHSTYLSRGDSIGYGFTYVDAQMQVTPATCAKGTHPVCAVFGIVEQDTGRFVFVGVSTDQAGFVTWDNAHGTWAFTSTPAPVALVGTAFHKYRIRKGQLDAHLCIDGTEVKVDTRDGFQITSSAGGDFVNRTIVWGDAGNQQGSSSDWKFVRYGIGTDGGGCF